MLFLNEEQILSQITNLVILPAWEESSRLSHSPVISCGIREADSNLWKLLCCVCTVYSWNEFLRTFAPDTPLHKVPCLYHLQ